MGTAYSYKGLSIYYVITFGASTKEQKNLHAEKFELIKEAENTTERDSQINILEEKITAKVLSNQRLKLEKELVKLKDMKSKKGKSAAIFHLTDKVVGRKKTGQEATTMMDPVTSEELVTRGKIKEELYEITKPPRSKNEICYPFKNDKNGTDEL